MLIPRVGSKAPKSLAENGIIFGHLTLRAIDGIGTQKQTRFPSSPLIIRYPFSYYSVLIRETKKKKGKRVLLENLAELLFFTLQGCLSPLKEAANTVLKPLPLQWISGCGLEGLM